MGTLSAIRSVRYLNTPMFCRLYPSSQGLFYSNYQSSISLKNLYPTSSLRLTTIDKVPEDPSSKFNGYIPIDSLKITYSRSSGPGGQLINTLNTKVDLRLHVESAAWLHPEIKAKLLEKNRSMISKEGYLIIKSDKTRSQQLNLADAMDRLRTIIRSAEFVPAKPSPETVEQIRRKKERASQARLIEKRQRSLIKESRKVDF
uniref:Large ribosomal subunit protein mL62 n=2 Tax=Clastoptera arizonana TaxID=38151 RepID=A0A1B6E016_9HEMI